MLRVASTGLLLAAMLRASRWLRGSKPKRRCPRSRHALAETRCNWASEGMVQKTLQRANVCLPLADLNASPVVLDLVTHTKS